MQLHVGVNEELLEGYTNIDPITQGAINISLLSDLNAWVNDAECIKIVANNVLDYIPASHMVSFLETLTKKLRHGSTLSVGGTDLYSVALALVNGNLTIPDANIQIHGDQTHAWSNKHGQISMVELCEILTSLGLTITKKQCSNYKLEVEGIRP